MTPRINTRYIAATLCAGLLVATMAANPARAENGEITRALAGLAALGLIGAAIADAQRDRTKAVVTPPAPAPQRNFSSAPLVAPGMARFFIPEQQQVIRKNKLPARCLRNVNIAGIRWLYDDKCLKERSTAALPKACKVSVKRDGKKAKGYLPNCLIRRGWGT